ncbi:hypothetical protein BD414DRAFT_201633 [Trametes punicea]|nr:hypothetical protein BD414DRAFT_201633 [Trametes punicea]
MVSVHNPFRDPSPALPSVSPSESPNHAPSNATSTSVSESQVLPSVPPSESANPVSSNAASIIVSQSQSSSNAEPPQPFLESPSRPTQHPASARSPTPPEMSVNDLITEELPPAYTPSPNVYEGETTIELGPRRPFQQPLLVPPQNQQYSSPPWVSPQPTASSNWSSSPGTMHRESPSSFAHPGPPPGHPSLQNSRAPPLPSRPLSDFARDFYTAGADASSGVPGVSSAQYQGDRPGSSQSGTRYAPPSGEPPSRSAKDAHSSSASDQIPDDGRPTERPVPGHPLLREGKILVYPREHECQKCHNTGYRNYDPSYPCSRCWEKYAKPYTGVIAHAPWSSDAQSGSSSSHTTFQRPLPHFRAPQASLHQQSASYSGPSPSPGSYRSRSASPSRVGSGYPGAAARVIPIAGGGVPMSPYLEPLQGGGRQVFPPPSWVGSPPVVPVAGPPPPARNVVVYPPGDPRIGGRLCWRCGGSGKTSFFIFDEDICGVCNGVGRTFV